MVDIMDMVLAIVDTMDTVLDMAFMESVRLKLMPTCMVDTMDMVLDTADTMVMVLVLDTDTMESVKLSQRLMLMHTCTADTMDMVLDMPDTMDILMVDIPTLDKLFPPDIKMDSQPSLFSLSVTTFSVLDIILGDK